MTNKRIDWGKPVEYTSEMTGEILPAIVLSTLGSKIGHPYIVEVQLGTDYVVNSVSHSGVPERLCGTIRNKKPEPSIVWAVREKGEDTVLAFITDAQHKNSVRLLGDHYIYERGTFTPTSDDDATS